MKLKKIKENKENTPEQRAKKIKKERRKLITVIGLQPDMEEPEDEKAERKTKDKTKILLTQSRPKVC